METKETQELIEKVFFDPKEKIHNSLLILILLGFCILTGLIRYIVNIPKYKKWTKQAN